MGRSSVPCSDQQLGDLSYGIYIYHFPMIQFFLAAGWLAYGALVFGAAITFVVFALAFCSWWFVEKPMIRPGKRLGSVLPLGDGRSLAPSPERS